LDAQNGKVLANLPIGKGTDGAAFDPVRKLAYSSNADGTLSVVAERDANTFQPLPDIKTALGARTMSLDPQSGRIFLVSATASKIEPAATPEGHPHITFAPNSAKLLVLERGH
jgi:DNA-binding beta-propeller fold protein YncE